MARVGFLMGTPESKMYRWRCVHCGKGWMSLSTGRRHLNRLHKDCWSCELEAKLLSAMIAGKGYVVEGDPFAHYTHSRA